MAGKDDVTVPVTLESRVTEIGTLELWCVARGGSRSLEARAQHPGARALTTPPSPRAVIGIDLGTTNSALAWAEARGADRHLRRFLSSSPPGEVARPRRRCRRFSISPIRRSATPALVAAAVGSGAGRRRRRLRARRGRAGAGAADRVGEIVAVESARRSDGGAAAVGRRRRAAAVAGRGVGARCSRTSATPGTTTARRTDETWRLERQHVVLTVPASFDEEARELTVEAAKQAGLEQVTLLEEPLAALYAWIAAHRRQLAEIFADGALILVCDVGGGTTDFSLIRARIDEGELAFERIAIGEHLLLGGDNLDLALASLVEQKLASSGRLTLTQRQVLRRKCTAAKESLLADTAPIVSTITVLGSGRGVVGGGMTTELTREEVVSTLTEGFLPLTAPERSARTRSTGRTARARVAVRDRTGDHATSRRRF